MLYQSMQIDDRKRFDICLCINCWIAWINLYQYTSVKYITFYFDVDIKNSWSFHLMWSLYHFILCQINHTIVFKMLIIFKSNIYIFLNNINPVDNINRSRGLGISRFRKILRNNGTTVKFKFRIFGGLRFSVLIFWNLKRWIDPKKWNNLGPTWGRA